MQHCGQPHRGCSPTCFGLLHGGGYVQSGLAPIGRGGIKFSLASILLQVEQGPKEAQAQRMPTQMAEHSLGHRPASGWSLWGCCWLPAPAAAGTRLPIMDESEELRWPEPSPDIVP